MQKLQKTLYAAIIASEASHVFCCVLPTLFSVFSLLAGLGLATAMPIWLQSLHAALHGWEPPMIALSGSVVAFGWALYLHSRRIDCHSTGCKHGSCAPQKNRAHVVLKIATLLFIVNISVYLVFHRGLQVFVPDAPAHEQAGAHEH